MEDLVYTWNWRCHPRSRCHERHRKDSRTEGERGYPGHALVRLNQPICQSVRSGTVPMLAAGDTFGTQARLSANTRAARPVLLRASHENARRHEVTPRCLTRHEPALSAQSFILHHTGCLGVLTAPTAMRLVDPVVISLSSPLWPRQTFLRSETPSVTLDGANSRFSSGIIIRLDAASCFSRE